jgi:hypothetical protein
MGSFSRMGCVSRVNIGKLYKHKRRFLTMGKQKYPESWQESPPGKAAKPGFGGKDTRIFSGGKAEVGTAHPVGKKAKGISITGE